MAQVFAMTGQVDKGPSVHTLEWLSASNGGGIRTQAATWMSPEDRPLNETSQAQKYSHCRRESTHRTLLDS